MVGADRARPLLPGWGWLALFLVLGLGTAGVLAPHATADMQDKQDKQAALKAADAHSAQIGRVSTLLKAVSTDLRSLRQVDEAARHLDTLAQLDAAAAALRDTTPLIDRPYTELLVAHLAALSHLHREVARLAAESALDDARLLLDSEPVRLNRLSLMRTLDAMAAAAAEESARSAAALSAARQHGLSQLVGLLAAMVLLAFLQVVRLARRPAGPETDPLNDQIGLPRVG